MRDEVEPWASRASELLRAREANPTAEAEESAARACIDLGRVLESNRRIEEATRWYERVWDDRARHESALPYAAHAAHNLGFRCEESGRFDEAGIWYERAYELRNSGAAAEEAARLSVVSLMNICRRAGDESGAHRWSECLFDNLWIKTATRTSDPPLELTPAQEGRWRRFVDEWIDQGRSTRPSDRAVAERGIQRLYALGGRPRPRILWGDSPAQCLALMIASELTLAKEIRIDRLVPDTAACFWPHIRSQLRRKTQARRVPDAGHIRWLLWSGIGTLVWQELGESGRPGELQFRRRRAPQAWEQRGPHDVVWIADSLFCRDELGVQFPREPNEVIDACVDVVRSAGYWWPFEDVCFVSERPCTLEVDTAGRLHSERGPALAFRDGFGFSAWHGLRIPADWIRYRDELDPILALVWPNIEQRRALAEMLGPDRILGRLPHTTVDADPDPQIGTLLSVKVPGKPAALFLRVRCATGREFTLRVPPGMLTARQANAWTYGLDANQYELEVRT